MDIEAEFNRAMMDIYIRAKNEARYTASIFHRMLCERGGLATARYLINDPIESQGYTALWERGRLDLTVEAVVVENERWHRLFEDQELEKARQRLAKYGYSFSQTSDVDGE